MGIKLEKTAKEFMDSMDECLPMTFTRGDRRRIAEAVARALDLEFQEPGGRGEGVPEGLSLSAGGEGEVTACRSDGSVWLNPCLVCGCDDYVDPESAQRFQLLVDTANQVPALLALARELEDRLNRYHERHGEISAFWETTYALLARARDLLDRLEGGRE